MRKCRMNSTGSYSENLRGSAAQRAAAQGVLQAAVHAGAGPGLPLLQVLHWADTPIKKTFLQPQAHWAAS